MQKQRKDNSTGNWNKKALKKLVFQDSIAEKDGTHDYFHLKTQPSTGTGDQIPIPFGTYAGQIICKPDTAGTFYYQSRNNNGQGGQIIISN